MTGACVGLARPSEHLDSGGAEVGPTSLAERVAGVTRVGTVVGTPAYMAPEQLGGVASAAADQFSYSVTLWEALFGERPFVGSTVAELTGALLRGEIRDPRHPGATPAWLRRAVRRGLALDPSARWPSVAAQLDAIEGGRSRARTRRVMLGAAALAAVGAALFGATRIDRARVIRACDAEAAAIDEVWNESTREQVRASFASAGTGYAAMGATKVGAALDRWAV